MTYLGFSKHSGGNGEIVDMHCDRCGRPAITGDTHPPKCDGCIDMPEEGAGG